MNHSIYYVLGMLAGMLTAIGLALAVFLIYRKRRGKPEYDERQRLSQGKAYKAAFYTLLFYSILYGLFDMMTGIQWCELYTGLFIGVLLSVMVFAVICIKEDAYISFRRKPAGVYAILLVLAVVNLLPVLLYMNKPGHFIADGLLTVQAVNPMVGVALIIVVLAMAIRDLAIKSRQEQA